MDEKKVYSYEKIDFCLLTDRLVLPEDYKSQVKKNWKELENAGKCFTNGSLYTMSSVDICEDTITIFVQETDYSHYLYSKTQKVDKFSCRSIAANALFLTCDNYFVMGKMSSSTSLANKVKFVGGAIDSKDVFNGHIDIFKCVKREVKEEVGIDLCDQKIVSEVNPIAFLTRSKFSFINTLYLAKLKIDKKDVMKIFQTFRKEIEQRGDISELSELVFVKNDLDSVHKLFDDKNLILIDYMEEFFKTYFGLLEYGEIRGYIKENLSNKTRMEDV